MRAILALVLSLAASVGSAEETWLCKAPVATGNGFSVLGPFLMTGTPKRYTWKDVHDRQNVIKWVSDGFNYGIYVGGFNGAQFAYYLEREERKLTMQWFLYKRSALETTCHLQN